MFLGTLTECTRISSRYTPRRIRSTYGQLQSLSLREGPYPASATSFSQYSRGKYSPGWEGEEEKSSQLEGAATLQFSWM